MIKKKTKTFVYIFMYINIIYYVTFLACVIGYGACRPVIDNHISCSMKYKYPSLGTNLVIDSTNKAEQKYL